MSNKSHFPITRTKAGHSQTKQTNVLFFYLLDKLAFLVYIYS